MENLCLLKLYYVSINLLIWISCAAENTIFCQKLPVDPDFDKNVTQIISSKGYPVQIYEVTTEDGYILEMLRIPHGKHQYNNANNQKRMPVLLMHGAFADCASYVLNHPNQSLGFILADEGYDVWLGNVRGTPMSRRHQNLTSDSLYFWNFSLDEMAKYDLPAFIDGVLESTKQNQLIYIGYSQGTTIAFALLSEMPKYNQKIKLFIALAPITSAYHSTNVLRSAIPYMDNYVSMLKLIGKNEVNGKNPTLNLLAHMICSMKGDTTCYKSFVFLFFEFNFHHINTTRYPVYEKFLSASISVNSLLHYKQLAISKYFTHFDYGLPKNLKVYNQTHPPVYDVKKVTVPVILVWAEKDTLSDRRDIELLKKKLPNALTYRVPRRTFNHLDFLIALDARSILYDSLLSKMLKFSQ